METSLNEMQAFLDALLGYYRATGTLEPLTKNEEDNRTALHG